MAIDYKNYTPSSDEILAIVDAARAKWKSDEEIYNALVSKWWINRDEEMEKSFKKKVPIISNYDEQKAKEWEQNFNDLTNQDTTNDSVDEVSEKVEDEWTNLAAAPATIQMITQALSDKVWKEWATKILDWVSTKWAKWLWSILWKSSRFVARNAWAIATGLISAYETYNDRDKWKVKAEYINGNEWALAYLRDVWRNAYAYADNVLFWALPNIDSVYNQTKWEQKQQAEKLAKNKEVKNTAKELKQYTKVMDKLKWNEEQEAVRQMTNVAVNQWKLNDVAFKKQFVKDYERKTMKKPDGSTYQTWVSKSNWRPVWENI